jgi:LPXTG-motif cell wall-anchored protein
MAASSQAASNSVATGGSIGADGSSSVNWTLIAVAGILAVAVLVWLIRRKKS